MRTKLKLMSAVGALVLAGTLGLTACNGSSNNAGGSATEEASQDSGAGFEEYPVGDDQVAQGKDGVNELDVSVVYFQPVDMEPQIQTPAKDASMHIEADISALEGNDLGYGVGDFIPGLTVEYKILGADGKAVLEGTFMPMNASDGPHYGLNLPKLDAGTYTVQFIVHSPEENGWLLHTDETTGVKGRFWTEPITAEFKDWKWDPSAVEW